MANLRIEQLSAAGTRSLSDIIAVVQSGASPALQTSLSAYNTLWRALISTTATGLTYTPATGVLSLTAGYTIPTTASLGNYFVQGGNTFGAAAVLGTNDVQDLFLQVNGGYQFRIESLGGLSASFYFEYANISNGGDKMLTIDSATGKMYRQSIPSVTAITSINADTTAAQTLVVGTSVTWSDFHISTAAGVTTFDLPTASPTVRGLMSIGVQAYGGVKTFNDGLNSKYVALTGTAGAGYMYLLAQSATPTAPASGVNIYGVNNSLAIQNLAGFNGYLSMVNATATRTFTFPDATGTLALGTGQAVNRIGYWNGSTTIAGSSGFVYDGTATARIAGGASQTSWRISRDAGQSAGLGLETTGALLRWALYVNNTAEAGADAGSDLVIRGYDDAGALIGDYMTIARASGNAAIGTSTVTDKLNIGAGHLAFVTVGKGLKFTAGVNAKFGTATLVAGTKTVATTAVSATKSHILVTVKTLGTVAAPKAMVAGTIVDATSFVITSSDNTDTSVVEWFIFDEL